MTAATPIAAITGPAATVIKPPRVGRAGMPWTPPTDARVMVWAPPGKFEMGRRLPPPDPAKKEAPPKDEMPPHPPTITNGFFIDVAQGHPCPVPAASCRHGPSGAARLRGEAPLRVGRVSFGLEGRRAVAEVGQRPGERQLVRRTRAYCTWAGSGWPPRPSGSTRRWPEHPSYRCRRLRRRKGAPRSRYSRTPGA